MSIDPAASQAKQGIQTSVENINSILNKTKGLLIDDLDSKTEY